MSPVELHSQSDLQNATYKLTEPNPLAGRKSSLCYLCGSALPPKGPGFKANTSIEHIIPKSLLGTPPEGTDTPVPFTATVHRVCDSKYKRKFDELYGIFNKINSSDFDSIPKSDIPIVQKLFEAGSGWQNHDAIPMLGGANLLEHAVWTWIRGLHSLLHSSFVPLSMARSICFPAPVIDAEQHLSIDEQIHNQEQQRSLSAMALVVAGQVGHLNSARAWNNTVAFANAWFSPGASLKKRMKRNSLHGSWPICYWALRTPGLNSWKTDIPGAARYWFGQYKMPTTPSNAQHLVLSQDAIKGLPEIESLEDAIDELMS